MTIIIMIMINEYIDKDINQGNHNTDNDFENIMNYNNNISYTERVRIPYNLIHTTISCLHTLPSTTT